MTEKAQTESIQHHLDKEELGQQIETNKIGEVGVIDAPDGGRAAWTVIFGCFCVSKKVHSRFCPYSY